MTESVTPPAPANTLPPATVNGSELPSGDAPAAAPVPGASAPAAPGHRKEPRPKMHTRVSGVRTALIAGMVLLVLVLIFVVQNAHAVSITFFGAHVHLSLAVALLLAAVAGAVIMAAAETARITQLRQMMRRDRRKRNAG